MLEKKDLYIANFNCTFGKEDEPMLEYFSEIILPAFKQNEIRESGKNKFQFMNVNLIMSQGDFAIAGQIVKSTNLEIKTVIKDNKLENTNNVYKSDPFSYFLINLKNHRMTLVKNQSGSPDLGNFAATARFLLERYVHKTNANILNKNEKLPRPTLNVVAIPFEGQIKEELKKVEKIKNVTLRFYPLNGDEDTKKTFSHFREILHETGSKSGNTQINTPKNHDEVAELLHDTAGLVSPTIRVSYRDKSQRTLKGDTLTEKLVVELEDDGEFRQNIDRISGKVVNKEEYKGVSEENKSLYGKWFDKLYALYNSML